MRGCTKKIMAGKKLWFRIVKFNLFLLLPLRYLVCFIKNMYISLTDSCTTSYWQWPESGWKH